MAAVPYGAYFCSSALAASEAAKFSPRPFRVLALKEQEPGADRAVSVLEPGRGETVFHHGKLGADLGPEVIGGAGVPHRVPGAALALADRPRLVDVDRAAAGDHAGLALEDVDLVLAHREADRARDLVGLVLVQEQLDDEDALEDVGVPDGFLGGLGDDPLVGLAVDHDLPLAGADRLRPGLQGPHLLALDAVQGLAGLVLLPDRQPPLLEQPHRVVDVAAEVEDQVFADDAHQVVADHADIVVRAVLADVGVDGRKPLGHGAGALHGRFVHQHDGLARLDPFFDFKRRAASGHAAADDEDVHLFLDDFRILDGLEFTLGFIRQCHMSSSLWNLSDALGPGPILVGSRSKVLG
jgi:hypothetical protein